LEYTKLSAGLADTNLETVNCRLLLRRVIEDCEPFILEKETAIVLSVSPEVPQQILGDEFRIAHILANLLNNAIQFSLKGGRVSIQAKLRDRHTLNFIVEDEGEGMTPLQLKMIFQPHAEQRSALKNPAGLGLLVTRLLVEDVLGGEIRLTSKPKAGTKCHVSLPFSLA
jgi:signal transduction histidine kinase